MFGSEYLDWCAEVRAGEAIEAFLAGMEPEDRKWVLSVLRKRHVTYRDRPQLVGSPLNLSTFQFQQQLANQRQNVCGHIGLLGGTLGNLGL